MQGIGKARNARRLTWLLIAALGLPVQAVATTVVVIRTPDEVIIAADSAATIHGDGGPGATETVCKIYELDSHLFFAVSGIVNDRANGFSVPDIVATASREARGMAAKLTKIEKAVQAGVMAELPRLKERDAAGYESLIHAKGAVTVMMAGIENGSPQAASFSLGLEVSPDGVIEPSVVRDSCPGNCASGTRVFWFGEGGAIERLRAARALPELPWPGLARYLVQAEIDAGAPSVGGPVDVLRILPDGPIWVQRKPNCPVAMTMGAQ